MVRVTADGLMVCLISQFMIHLMEYNDTRKYNNIWINKYHMNSSWVNFNVFCATGSYNFNIAYYMLYASLKLSILKSRLSFFAKSHIISCIRPDS